jgi:outer membrane receptor protein involved in Fe transport
VVSDTLSWVHGRHSFKFGGEMRDFRNNNFNNDPGTLVFKNTLGATNSFQSAQVLTAARTLGNVASRINQGALDFFGTDSWKIRSSLTLELGLRYAWNMTPSEAQDRFSTVVPAAGGGTIITPGSEPYRQNAKNFEPRVGFAWDVFRNSKPCCAALTLTRLISRSRAL